MSFVDRTFRLKIIIFFSFFSLSERKEVYVKQTVGHVKMENNTCHLQECLENLAAQFTKKQFTLGRYLEGISVLVAKKK
jgi:hypothetical protein